MTDDYEIVQGSELMDVSAIHSFLSTAYWSKGIPVNTVRRAINNSLCVGVFLGGAQVGFARATTDKATFAYIADVYILELHRGKGLSRRVLDVLFAHPDLQGLRRMMLATNDAHEIYTSYGFTELADARKIMENWKPNVYSDA